ncbi:MAG: hypothetical protein ABI557_09065, partial [Aureliella sp.]
MRLSFKSKPTAAALLALSGFGATQAIADGTFIVQPSRQKPAAVATAAVQPASELAQAIVQPVQKVLDTKSPHTINIAPSERSATLALSAPALATSDSTRRPASTTSSGGLKWIARGIQAAPRADLNSTGPLELENPSFVSPAPAASAPKFASQNLPAVEVPLPTVPMHSSTASSLQAFSLTSEYSNAEEELESPRDGLASLVSSQIMMGRPSKENPGRSVESIDNPPGWQAIGEELRGRLENCEALINRKAYFSAREDAESAMLYLMRVLDLMSNSYRSEPAWYAASKAISEAEDFSTTQRLTSDSDFLRRVIMSHETPVLKDADASTLAPLA